MNARTKEDMKAFCDSVSNLAQACILTIGFDTASEIISNAQKLKASLDADETLP